ncbi:MAG: ABC transporter permease [Candidatus Magasanikbacteria bacterium]|nr:ABC transporter permease [Candidatus Magasanikbacteria bacterium]
MMFKDLFTIAGGALLRQKMRTILTVVALGIGIASVVIIVSAGRGLESMVLGELDVYSPNTMNVEVRVPSKGGGGSATSMASGVTITTLKNSDMEAIMKHPNISLAYSYVTSQQVIKYREENQTVTVFGYGAYAAEVDNVKILEGRFYTPDEEASLAQVVFIGSKIKEDFFGDDTAVGKNIFIKGKSFRVVGVQEAMGASFGFDMDSIVYMPTETLQKRFLGTDYVMGINAHVIDMSQLDSTKEDVEMLLRERHDITDPDKDDFEVATMDEIRDTLETVVGGITLLLIALVCISLIVGGVGITNIMYVTVSERTFEIGLRKSLGAKSRDILLQFLIEAMLLTSMGGVIGVIFGVLVSYLVYLIATSVGLNWVFAVPLYAVVLAIGFSTAVGLFFGLYPAKKAAKLNPIEALRKE